MIALFIIIGVVGLLFGGVLIFFGAKSVKDNKKERNVAPVVVTSNSTEDKVFIVSSCSFKYNKANKDIFATDVLFKGKMSSLNKKEEVEDEK